MKQKNWIGVLLFSTGIIVSFFLSSQAFKDTYHIVSFYSNGKRDYAIDWVNFVQRVIPAIVIGFIFIGLSEVIKLLDKINRRRS
ncbi:hypothetical protein JUJ52_16110 [Virgibacillus sp. AGTR]|uniref:hypothetical protein n=1 Tax=Virgibacillus sp. AGTR TaxID=2812055 RepID=UPI001962BFED|nr:hypothetical protein [Virgibacillus sp. AGTR]MCC2251479.1 hypothetical protein [Virgibacillus sp. AGTR]QRZ19878.1 hypothetical protein JUJ52_09715 [Virgibacillus sp. AGTR]